MKGPGKNTDKKKEAGKAGRPALYNALLSLKTREECARFLRDLCTEAELDAMTERFAIARLVAKDVSYRAIADDTLASTTTVTRVAHWFHHGTGGYPMVISRMHKKSA